MPVTPEYHSANADLAHFAGKIRRSSISKNTYHHHMGFEFDASCRLGHSSRDRRLPARAAAGTGACRAPTGPGVRPLPADRAAVSAGKRAGDRRLVSPMAMAMRAHWSDRLRPDAIRRFRPARVGRGSRRSQTTLSHATRRRHVRFPTNPPSRQTRYWILPINQLLNISGKVGTSHASSDLDRTSLRGRQHAHRRLYQAGSR